MDDPEWTAVKALGQGEKVPMVYTTARDATLSLFNSQHVSCTNSTHSGRHSGAKEAVRLKVAEEDIRTGGRWVHGTGKMHQVYLDKQPITFALAMAGFSVKPFHLRRNEVAPSLELQRLIFPFIEEATGSPGSQENEQ
jgi:integrase